MTNIYVGNLPYATTEDELIEHFSQWGEVERATLVFDRESGRPRGFGFVEMNDDEEAREAIESAHGEAFNGRPLTVNAARPRGSGRTDKPTMTRTAIVSHEEPVSRRGYHSHAGQLPQVVAETENRMHIQSAMRQQRPTGGGYANAMFG